MQTVLSLIALFVLFSSQQTSWGGPSNSEGSNQRSQDAESVESFERTFFFHWQNDSLLKQNGTGLLIDKTPAQQGLLYRRTANTENYFVPGLEFWISTSPIDSANKGADLYIVEVVYKTPKRAIGENYAPEDVLPWLWQDRNDDKMTWYAFSEKTLKKVRPQNRPFSIRLIRARGKTAKEVWDSMSDVQKLDLYDAFSHPIYNGYKKYYENDLGVKSQSFVKKIQTFSLEWTYKQALSSIPSGEFLYSSTLISLLTNVDLVPNDRIELSRQLLRDPKFFMERILYDPFDQGEALNKALKKNLGKNGYEDVLKKNTFQTLDIAKLMRKRLSSSEATQFELLSTLYRYRKTFTTDVIGEIAVALKEYVDSKADGNLKKWEEREPDIYFSSSSAKRAIFNFIDGIIREYSGPGKQRNICDELFK